MTNITNIINNKMLDNIITQINKLSKKLFDKKEQYNFTNSKNITNIKNITKDKAIQNNNFSFNIMEVCGTHTMAIAKYGISQLLPKNINLISGPGCPVCVTSINDIDKIIEITNKYNVTIFTFGDMMKVPGSNSSFSQQKSIGKKIIICYSPLDAFEYAKNNPRENVIFIAIGFETTAPLTAVLLNKIYNENIKNLFIYSTHKIIPPALEALLNDENINIKAFLLPGHVSAIIGLNPYKFIAKKYNIPAVISGFEPESILKSILMILKSYVNNNPDILIEYNSIVKIEGNPTAQQKINQVFEITDSDWRGIGKIPKSGLDLKKEFSNFDAKVIFKIDPIISKEPPGCECGNILKGIKSPLNCKYFGKLCNPSNPIGPCMVSSEGACAAYFKYLT